MIRLTGVLFVAFLASCFRAETPYRRFPMEEQAVSLAAGRCKNPAEMDWLREVIKLAEADYMYKGSIYAIPFHNETVFLHDTWISDCTGCHVYDCEGEPLALTEAEKSEILATVKDEYVIYTSTH